jgi:hypothetical protein
LSARVKPPDMDSLTTHLLARELNTRWRGRTIAGVALDSAGRSVVLAIEGAPGLVFDLSRPDAVVREVLDPSAGPHLAGFRIVAVNAPVDERFIELACERTGRFRGSPVRRARLLISVIPAARGALLEDANGRRLTSIGARLPELAQPRPVLETTTVEGAVRAGDEDRLLAGRWMSPALARWLIEEPDRAAERYRTVCELPDPDAALCARELLPPWLCDRTSLIGREESGDAPEPGARRVDWRDRALQRMRGELERAAGAPRLRAAADALSALGDADPPSTVRLSDGSEVAIDARRGERAITAAERLYRDVRSMERALETLPRRIRELESAPRDERPAARTRTAGAQEAQPARPYRLYRSSGGLEIWVGRGAASNDLLTFRESSPADVWLHARSASGAHVVLRWQQEGAPPARDLEEAAALAAWHSKARGSTVVPVDWTRRKYVRRPRGGPPGTVLVTQSATIFVRPNHDLERRLRDSGRDQ